MRALDDAIRALVREEIRRALGLDEDDDSGADDAELRRLAAERAATMRRKRGAR